MFSDIELLICKTANDFLVQQYHHDRVSDHSINRAKRAWDAKNRPPVEEFNFDQATQRQLIVDNRESIYFPQEMRGNGALISTILRQWKAIIAQTKIRTCPMSDTGINMTLQDVKGVLEMLNACPKAMRCYHAIARWITRRLKLPRPTLPIIPEHRTIEIIQEHGANSRN